MKKHAELSEDGYIRYCDEHIAHGNLHECALYPDNIKQQIREEAEKFRKSCEDRSLKITMTLAEFDNAMEHHYSLGFKDGLLHYLKKGEPA